MKLILFFWLLLGTTWAQPALTYDEPGGDTRLADQVLLARAGLLEPGQARSAASGLLALTPGNPLEAAVLARGQAEAAVAMGRVDPALAQRLAETAERHLAFLPPWLEAYGMTRKVHDFDEPAWVRGQPDTVAHAVLAWVSLQAVKPDPARRQRIGQFAEGLALLLRKEPHLYPYRAHTSFLPGPELKAYAPTPSGEMAPGAAWILQNNPQVEALVEAGTLLQNPALIASAEAEGLGMLSHVVVSGKLLYGYLPRPEPKGNARGALVLVTDLMSLQRATQKPIYGILAGVAAKWAQPSGDAIENAVARLVQAQLQGTSAAAYRPIKDLAEPFSYQVMDAENGKAVIKAFDVMDIIYPGGFPGKLVTVGREQMFWMRFDVDREDDYFFYLVCLKTTQAGLVSVAMRIDGDKIFNVQLGGATDSSYMDMEFVAGPRHLRSGPHSFGIRFSGLLMKQPAILDAVVVQPVVERRLLELPGGESLLLLKNLKGEPVTTRMTEVDPARARITAVDGLGAPVQPAVQTDKKGRKLLVVPAAGTVALQFRADSTRK